ncbi:MAG: N-acetylmuramoyl-L-alanine amidase, partial [Oscillospiraceae bacterium]|nr:N-acetylmuramoyl-L-alanine amidase [Oscillospiraceae bacterium]
PEGAMNVEGESTIPITVHAYKNSSVTAKIGGVTIPLLESSAEGDSTDKNSNYVVYVGNYTAPQATETAQAIGNIEITGTWEGITQSAIGASVTVAALPPPEITVGEKGNVVEVTASQARTYPASVLNADPSGDCFPLPKGSRDFISSDLLSFTIGGTTHNYYILRSGVRVNAADVKVLGEQELVANNITEASVYADGGYTYLKLKQDQPMAFRAYLPSLGFDTNDGISSFESKSISFKFNFVDSVPEAIAVSENNIFSSATVTKDGDDAVVNLRFHHAGRFAGYKAYYQDGYLVFRFTNIPSSLSGAKIYIDPGHGGYDSGALPIEGMKTEAQINREIAQKVVAILQSRGANVQMTDTTNYVSLDARVNASQSYAPHLFVSIHQNSSTSPSAKGSEVWYFNPYSEIYADRISSSLSGALGTKDRGEKYGWYKVTTHMEFPAVLVECGFLSNVTEYDKLKNDDYQNAMATAIADGIAAAFTAK